MNRIGKVLVPLVLVIVLGVIVYLWLRSAPTPTAVSLSREEKLELLCVKNEALARLENAEFKQAAALFEKIVAADAAEPMGYRNLALAVFEPGGNEGRSGRKDSKNLASMHPLLAAVDRLLEKEPDSPASHFLAGLAYFEQADLMRIPNEAAFTQARERMAKHLKRAAELSPNDPAPLYTLYWVEYQWGNPEKVSDETLAALRAAAARAPENLVILLELAKWLAQRQDPGLGSVVDRALKALPASRQNAQKDDPHALLRQVQDLLQKEPKQVPPGVSTGILGAINLLGRHPAYQQDRRLILPHPLEFTQPDFRPEFYAGLNEEAEPAIPIRFEATPLDSAKGQQGPPIVAAAHEEISSDDALFVPYHVVLRSGGEVTRVELFTSKEGPAFEPLELKGEFTGFRLVDLDLDWSPAGGKDKNVPADLDLVVFGRSGVRVLENSSAGGKRHWVDRTDKANLPPPADIQWLLVCDTDHEGNLDLIAGLKKGVRILRNRGGWSFDDVTNRSPGLDDLETGLAAYGDFDRDGDLDFALLSRANTLVFLENRRSGRFAIKEQDGTFEGAACLLAADVNNDGRLDLVIGQRAAVTVLTRERDSGPFHISTMGFSQPDPIVELGGFDLDNDGRLDLWVRTGKPGKPLKLFRNLGSLFEGLTHLLPALDDPIRTVTVADVDDDGDLDLIVAGPRGVHTLRNHGGNQHHWLSIRLRAEPSKEAEGGQAAKCNYFNIGGQIEIKSGRHYQMLPVHGPRTHFGLGRRKHAEAARVLWTNGVPHNVLRPGLDQILTEDQKPKGSCPFLFTWNGEQFVFVTDCLWSSALGMQLAHGVLMDHERQHNYLTIRDDQLKPRDGRYVLQFTNELWEVPYLDEVQLWAVDHPAEVEVHTNQRIPPGKEPFRLVTATEKRAPRAARDHLGRDVLQTIHRRDGKYLGGFARRRYVGLAEPHWLELDLSDLSHAKRATLFLTGWIWPTDTSANVAISQDPRFSGPEGVVGGVQPPALLVPDGTGWATGWTTAIPSMGFPSGKLQTVAVDLPLDKFPPHPSLSPAGGEGRVRGDYRVRIATSMELYWDEVFFTVDEPAVDLSVTKLMPVAADLHYRGYSRVGQESRESPILFDYHDVDPGPRWLPVPGPYTRFGAVTELLRQPDSAYVVMSPGDELTLEFDTLPPPAPGRRRTFVFFASGWLKDFDLNGEASDGAGPLPFDGMSRYPYLPEEEKPPPEFQQFRARYVTREAQRQLFWEALRGRGGR